MAVHRKKEIQEWIKMRHADGTITKGELELRMHTLEEDWEKMLMDGVGDEKAR